jgi:hypothetical protein
LLVPVKKTLAANLKAELAAAAERALSISSSNSMPI